MNELLERTKDNYIDRNWNWDEENEVDEDEKSIC